MIRKFLALAILLLPLSCAYHPAMAQTCPTRPAGDNSNACASTAFVQGALPVVPSPANPTASVGNTVVNGTATTYMRSDAAPPLGTGVAAANVGTLGGVLGGTLPNPSMAAGAAATNVGTLGGDLSGTLPSPTVAKVQGLPYKSGSYSNGQTPVWNSTNNDFEPGTASGGNNPWIDVTLNGLKNDGKYITDGVCNATTTFTSATANFTSGDVGKTISAEGCGAAGATLDTTIASFTNSTTVILTAAAGSSATSVKTAYGTDNTSALNTLIATYPNQGRAVTLYFPAGIYIFNGQVTFTAKYLTFRGTQYSKTGGGANGFSGGGTVLAYVNTGAGNFLYGGSQTNGVLWQNFNFTWTSAGYSGTYLSIINDGGGDPGYNSVRDNTFNGNNNTATNTCINANKSISTQVSNNTFWFCSLPVSLGNSTGYCNGCVIESNFFFNYTTQAILGNLSGGSISKNVFEQSRTNVGSAWVDTAVAGASQGVIISNNWFGDGSSAAGGTGWITTNGYGISIISNMFGGTEANGIILNAVLGFNITGNYVNGTYINFVNYNAAPVNGGVLSGNAYHGVTNFEANTGNKGASTTNLNNVSF